MYNFQLGKAGRSLLIAGFALCGNAFASTVVSYDLYDFDAANSGTGNNYLYDTLNDSGDPVLGVDQLQVWAYSDEGTGSSILQQAEVTLSDDGYGLGVCNDPEGFRPNGNPVDCPTVRGPAVTSVDNVNEQDWLLFIIPNTPENEWMSFVLQSRGPQDLDISYWVGNLAAVPTILDTTGFSFTHINDDNNVADTPLFIDIGFVPGNALLIGASLTNADGTPDRPFVSAVTTTVPLPPAVWLFGSALGLLGWNRRRN